MSVTSQLYQTLHDSTRGTIEVVMQQESGHPDGSRIVEIGQRNDTYFGLEAENENVLRFRWNNSSVISGKWSIDLASRGRFVVHMVLDSGQKQPAARIRLYADGILLGLIDLAEVPMQGESIQFDQAEPPYLTLGNREIGSHTIQGIVYYAAIYSEALTLDQISHNANILSTSDDLL